MHGPMSIYFYKVTQFNKCSRKLDEASEANPLPFLLTGEFFLKNLLEKRKAEATQAE